MTPTRRLPAGTWPQHPADSRDSLTEDSRADVEAAAVAA